MDEREDDRLATFYAKRVAAHEQDRPGYGSDWADLAAAVLAHGGRHVVPPMEPEDEVTLAAMRTPALWPGERARLVAGRARDCHANTATLFLLGLVEAIATGYALSEDGLWRQHTWGIDPGGGVVETTVPRARYAGRVLTGKDAFAFALDNSGLNLADLEEAVARIADDATG